MRLICPNCGAQYEVPDSVIPDSGRDVQCSSCGTTWFQAHPDAALPLDDTQELEIPDPDWEDMAGPDLSATQPAPERVADAYQEQPPKAQDEWQGFPADPGLQAAPTTSAGSSDSSNLIPDPEDPLTRLPDIADDDYEEDPAQDLPTPRRRLDSSVAEMLREEAAREARARAADRRGTLESQPDLGLDAAPRPSPPPPPPAPPAPDAGTDKRRAQDAMAEATAHDASTTPQPPQAGADTTSDRQDAHIAAAVADSRRTLLPDIEEINSTLRATSDRRPARADDHDTPGMDHQNGTDTAPGRTFNRGFSVTILIAILLLALYVFAPTLQDAVPALSPMLQSYITVVDDLRLALDGQMQNLSRWLSDLAGTTG